MPEFLTTLTSLPNLHPAVVHFPIALLVTAVLFDLASLILRQRPWLAHAAVTLLTLGTLGLVGAWWTGGAAAGEMWSIPGAAQAALADHEEIAELTLLVFLAILAVRLLLAFVSRKATRTPVGVFRIIVIVAALSGLLLVAITADRGGALVYRHAMGVEVSKP